MTQIVVELPKDRDYAGTLRLEDDQGNVKAGPFPALGKADPTTAEKKGNASRDSTKPYGDTPLGGYKVAGFQAPKDAASAKRHGPFDRINLSPQSGDAATAAANGRTGIQIHGGFKNPNGTYRPTNGCIRLSDADMASLLAAISALGSAPTDGNIKVTDLQVVVLAGPPTDEDSGDPPSEGTPMKPMPTPIPPGPPPTPPPAPPPIPVPPPAPGPPPAHDLDAHDRDPHDRDPHDRDAHDLDPHDLDPHDLDPHDLDPHDLDPHDLDPHDQDPHDLLP